MILPPLAGLARAGFALACLVSGAGCGTRPVTTPATVDGGSGGLTGTGGRGTAGTGSASGGTTGTGGSASDAATDGTADGAALCEGIRTEYAAALRMSQECTLGAAHQCEQQVRASFFCNCTTYTNGGVDALAAIVARYEASGCLVPCAGICVQVRPLSCVADTTSTTGARCKLPDVLTLTAADDGRAFSVSVGDEIDITLESIAPGSYSIDVGLSSEIATVLEVTIPAGPPNPYGPTRLYRLRLLSVGQLQVQIPFEPTASGSPRGSYAVSITSH